MNKEEAIKILQHYLEMEEFNNAGDFLIAIDTVLNLIQKQESIIDKKDKIIDEMIQEYEYNVGINVKNFCDEEIRKEKCIQDCTNCIKEYFTNKAMSEKPTKGE